MKNAILTWVAAREYIHQMLVKPMPLRKNSCGENRELAGDVPVARASACGGWAMFEVKFRGFYFSQSKDQPPQAEARATEKKALGSDRFPGLFFRLRNFIYWPISRITNVPGIAVGRGRGTSGVGAAAGLKSAVSVYTR